MKKPLTRRSFLHVSAGTTGAAMAYRYIPLESIAIPPKTAVPPSDRLRLGIIGVGMQGSPLLGTAVSLPGVECVAAADLYDGRHLHAQEIVGSKIKTTRK